MAMTAPLAKQPPTAPHDAERRPLINARSVAWALSTAAVCCLAAGVVVIRSLGGVSATPHLKNEPEVVFTQPEPQANHPTVLESQTRTPSGSVEGFSGYESLFAPPAGVGQQPELAPRPRSAALPSPLEQGRVQ